jgi:lambda repressor-like predicted transcriptional regulator
VTGPSDEGGAAPTLRRLIRSRMDERGWSYADLERESGGALSRGRWQQLGSADAQHKFPHPESLRVIAQVLEVDVTSVVLAAARAVGLPVPAQTGDFADRLPAGTERLSLPMRDAILGVVRAAVAATAAGPAARETDGVTLEWPKDSAPSRQRSDGPIDYEEVDL